jgi:hypothetical protein
VAQVGARRQAQPGQLRALHGHHHHWKEARVRHVP